jgi:hypothetical protein
VVEVSRQCADGACCVGPFLKGGPRLVKLVPVLSVSRPGAARGATCKKVGRLFEKTTLFATSPLHSVRKRRNLTARSKWPFQLDGQQLEKRGRNAKAHCVSANAWAVVRVDCTSPAANESWSEAHGERHLSAETISARQKFFGRDDVDPRTGLAVTHCGRAE